MEIKDENKYKYSAISIKEEVAVRFRRFSKKFSKSHSEVLTGIMNFFEYQQINPFDGSLRKLTEITIRNGKKIDKVIAILKNIEKTQIKPIHIMIKLLFQKYAEGEQEKEPRLIEKKFFPELYEKEDKPVAKIIHDGLKGDFKEYRKTSKELLKHIEYIEPRFGKPYLKVNLSLGEYKHLRNSLTNE